MLFNLGILVSVHQVPIDIFHLRNGGDRLCLKSEIGEPEILFGNVDEALVCRKPEALQQRLSDGEIEIRSELRAEDIENTVRGRAKTVVRHGEICAQRICL